MMERIVDQTLGLDAPAPERPDPVDTEPRRLTDGDITAFERAANARPEGPRAPTKKEVSEFMERLSVVDPFRLNRMRRDRRWVEKQARKVNFPESSIPWDRF